MPTAQVHSLQPSFLAFKDAFEEGVLMYARMLWQDASHRQQRAYPAYAMSKIEFADAWYRYHNRVGQKLAIPMQQIEAELLDSTAMVPFDTEDLSYAYIVGENLRCVSMFRCSIGQDACAGDLESFLRNTWDLCHGAKERKLIRSLDGRARLLLYLHSLLTHAGELILMLAKARGVDSLPYWYFDADNIFTLDREVFSTSYLALRSLVEYAEGVPGHA